MLRKGNPYALLVGIQTGAAAVGSSMEIPKKKKLICLLTQQSHSGNISEGTQNIKLKEQKHIYVHCSIIYNHQDIEAAQVSICG